MFGEPRRAWGGAANRNLRSALKAWRTRLAKRTGTKNTAVAVARKLSVILYRMLRDGSELRRSAKEAQVA